MGAKLIGLGLILLLGLLALAGDDDSPPAPTCPPGWQCDGQGCRPVMEPRPSAPAGERARLDDYYRGQARPAVDLPYELRKKNWGGGSCVHASTITLLRWLAFGAGDPEMNWLAEHWPYSGGEYSSRHRERIEKAGLRYVMTVDGDTELLKWAILTRRGCAIAHDGHCYNVVGYDDATGEVITLDNNHTQRYDYTAWSEKVRQWQRGGGWAFAFVYDPPAPLPTLVGWR